MPATNIDTVDLVITYNLNANADSWSFFGSACIYLLKVLKTHVQ